MRVMDKLFGFWVVRQPRPSRSPSDGSSAATSGPPLTALLWGGLVRVFLLHHVTWSINSICHFFGRRRFDVEDESRNVFWLAPLSMGEAWHHNHHAFPTSAFHGLRLVGAAHRPDRPGDRRCSRSSGLSGTSSASARSARLAKTITGAATSKPVTTGVAPS